MCDCVYCKSTPVDFSSLASIPLPTWLQVRDEKGKYLTNVLAKTSHSFITKENKEYESLSCLCKALSVRKSNIHFMKQCDGGFARSTPILVMKRQGCNLFAKRSSSNTREMEDMLCYSDCKNSIYLEGVDTDAQPKLHEKRPNQKEDENEAYFVRPSITHESLLSMDVEEYAKSIPKFLVRSSRVFDSHLDPPLTSIRSLHKPFRKAPYASCIFLHSSGAMVETDVYLCTLHMNPAYRPYIDYAEKEFKHSIS